MIPLKDENPHPPGFKPTITIVLLILVTSMVAIILVTRNSIRLGL